MSNIGYAIYYRRTPNQNASVVRYYTDEPAARAYVLELRTGPAGTWAWYEIVPLVQS